MCTKADAESLLAQVVSLKTNSASGHISFVHSVQTEGSASSTWNWKYRFQKDSCDFCQSLPQKWAVVDTRRSRMMLEG